MRVCFISITNLFLCPYIKEYYRILEDECDIDLIYWDRHNIDETYEDAQNVYRYDVRLHEHTNKISKLIQFIKYSRYCKRIINKNRYDRLIFLHNNIALLLSSYLRRKYAGKYVIDIRDYTMERNCIYYLWEKTAIRNAGFAVISSEGYKEFLPKVEYIISHNTTEIVRSEVTKIRQRDKSKTPVQISFIGLVRFYDQNRHLLDMFGNDERFTLAFYGQNSEPLKVYAEKCGYKNVVFEGRFDPKETVNFYKDTMVINNYYGNETMALKYALSNKLYYAAILGIPILVCDNTYMKQIAMGYDFGIMIGENSAKCADEFYNDYSSIDWEQLFNGCDRFLEKVDEDNDLFRRKLLDFIGIE